MFKKFISPLLFAAAALSFASCDEKEPDVVAPVHNEIEVQAFYKGDVYENGTGNLWINFVKGVTASGDSYIGPGYILCLDFNTALAENPDFATLAPGTYTISQENDGTKGTINAADEESFLERVTIDGAATDFEIKSGTVDVACTKDGVYTIKVNVVLSNDDPYVFEYTGPISFVNKSGEGEMSNLTGNVAVEGLSQGLVVHYGPLFTDTSDACTVLLAGPDYNLDENYGKSPALMLTLDEATTADGKAIPSGTYNVVNINEVDDLDVFTAISGVYEPALGGYFGTWYFATTPSQVEASVKSGTIKVTSNGNSNYTFEVNLKDGYGHTITAKYSGKVQEYWDLES